MEICGESEATELMAGNFSEQDWMPDGLNKSVGLGIKCSDVVVTHIHAPQLFIYPAASIFQPDGILVDSISFQSCWKRIQ